MSNNKFCKFCGHEIREGYDPLRGMFVWYHKETGSKLCGKKYGYHKAQPKD
ncbi:MAG: hypothetical protein QXH07_01295 [Thermoplasmata archaeon]